MLVLESANVTGDWSCAGILDGNSVAVVGGAVLRNRGVFSERACSENQVISFHCGKVHCPFLLGN